LLIASNFNKILARIVPIKPGLIFIARGKQDVLQLTAHAAMALPRLRRATKLLSIGRLLR
jgi:hypothetical protein